MKNTPYLTRLLLGITAAGLIQSASAHIGYGGRDFGTLVPGASPVTIENQAVTGNYGWAAGTDDVYGDAHRLRSYRFNLASAAFVTITFSASTNGGTRDGSIKPAFSVYRGLAHIAPPEGWPEGHSADYDTSAITSAWLALQGEPQPKRGAFRSLADWRAGGDAQTGPDFDFEDPITGLSTFTYVSHAVDGNGSQVGNVPHLITDGNLDGTVSTTIFLTPGDYSIFVGGTERSGLQGPDSTSYGLTGTVSASQGLTYRHHLTLGGNQSGTVSRHVGAWSWEDNALFGGEGQGTEPVGWTHTSDWVALRLTRDTVFTITMERDENVPWPSTEEPDRLADTSSMFPSLTLWKNWHTAGGDSHSYNNRGPISWAPGLEYLDHVDNSTATSITRSWFLPAGDYSMVLGSNAPANNLNRQGYRFSYQTEQSKRVDPVPVVGGVKYTQTISAKPGESGSFSSHVGAWSWEDNALFGNPGQGTQPVGWTHTSNWLALNIEQDASHFTITIERDATVPWPSTDEPDRMADISSMFPSLTLYRGWDNDGPDSHTYNNRGNVAWAEKIRYMDHVDNSTAESITRTFFLPKGQYSIAIGSNAPANNTNRQGYKLSYSSALALPSLAGDPFPGGVGYSHILSIGAGDSGSLANHVGAWSWEDNALFGGEGQGTEPVGWTHTSRWVGIHIKHRLTLTVSMERNANVPWPSGPEPDRMADTESMFPSFTLWRNWHNSGSDSHTYNNRGAVSWAPSLDYMDHLDNSTATSISRSYTLEPGYYTMVLGSNAPANNLNRQGFTFSWETSSPTWEVLPVITRQPRSTTVVQGRKTKLSARVSSSAGTQLQWFQNGVPVPGETKPDLIFNPATAASAGVYELEVRTASAWFRSDAVTLHVITPPVLEEAPALPDGFIGHPYALQLPGIQNASYDIQVRAGGLKANGRTGTIAGRPREAGDFDVAIRLINPAGASEWQTSTLKIWGMSAPSVGTFTGALGRSQDLNDNLGGCISVITTGSGAFSLQLKNGAKTHRLKGFLGAAANSGNRELTDGVRIVRRPRPEMALTLSIHSENGHLSGTLSTNGESLPFTARRPAAAPAPMAGAYTFALAAEFGEQGNPGTPQGFSIGSLRLQDNGQAIGAIRLADDTLATFSARLEDGDHLTLFNLLYRKTGSLVGVLSLQRLAEGNLRLSEVSWFKRQQPLRSKDRIYKSGFGPLNLEVMGRRYDMEKSPLENLGLTANPDGNASLLFEQGGISNPATQINLSNVAIQENAGQPIIVIGDNPASISLAVQAPVSNSSKVSLKDFSITKKGDTGSFTLVDSSTSSGAPVPILRPGMMRGTIVHDGTKPRLMGYFLLPEMPAAGSTAVSRTAALHSGAWYSN